MLMNRSRRYFVEQTGPRTLGIAPLEDQGKQALSHCTLEYSGRGPGKATTSTTGSGPR